MKLKPPIPWVGGKGSLIDEILPRFPPKYEGYVEVFGGAAALLHAKRPERGEIYNDANSDLTNMFRCIRDRPLALLKELGFLPFCGRDEFAYIKRFLEKEEFDENVLREEIELAELCFEPVHAAELREIMLRSREEYCVQRAAMFIRRMRYSFGAGGNSYACKGVDIRRFFYLIHQTSRRFSGVNIENQGYDTLIPHYDRKGVLIYLDPPYWGAEDYDVPFFMRDHLDLRNLLREIKGFFILSYNDHPCVRYLYKDFRIVELKRYDSLAMTKGKYYSELLIFNYDPDERERQAPAQISLF